MNSDDAFVDMTRGDSSRVWEMHGRFGDLERGRVALARRVLLWSIAIFPEMGRRERRKDLTFLRDLDNVFDARVRFRIL